MRTKKESGGRAWLSAIGSGLITFLMLALLGLAVALVVVPRIMGGMSLTVLTGSMEPGIRPGDVVVTRGVGTDDARDLSIGDVIVFLPYPDDPTLVTHRIMSMSVSAEGYSFVTQGDANNSPDPWGPVFDYQVRGEVVYKIPWIGHVRQWFSGLGGVGVWIIPAFAVLLIGFAIVSFLSTFRKTPETHETAEDEQTDGKPGGKPGEIQERANDQQGYESVAEMADDDPPPAPRRAVID